MFVHDKESVTAYFKIAENQKPLWSYLLDRVYMYPELTNIINTKAMKRWKKNLTGIFTIKVKKLN